LIGLFTATAAAVVLITIPYNYKLYKKNAERRYVRLYNKHNIQRIGSDRRPETKQGIKGKIVRFRSGSGVRYRVRVMDKDRRSKPDRRSEPNTMLLKISK